MLQRYITFIFWIMFISLSFGCAQLTAANIPFVKGFNLTEDGDQLLEVGNATMLSRAQKAVLEAKRLGANHIIINPRAAMLGPYSNKIIPIFPMKESPLSMSRKMVAFLKWTREQNLTVQIRPILFVVKELQGLTPYTSEEDGKIKNWWHGNIQPSDPTAWFESLREYHDIYLKIAAEAKIEFYTLGAELYSMTVGIQGDWPQYPVGFAKDWNHFLNYARKKLASDTLIMYDVTYTDATVTENSGLLVSGGEFERWHNRLMSSDHNNDWFELKQFWQSIDIIGIDMYRSLAGVNDQLPKDYNQLVKALQIRTDRYANQISSSLMEIELTLDIQKPVMFKEVGFRSSENALVNPFIYDSPNEKINLDHQAAAYQAFINSFFVNQQDWLKGVSFWDISIGGKRQGEKDAGFTPLGKKKSEAIIIDFFGNKVQ